MKEINDSKILDQNMEEKTGIANKVNYKKKSLENLTISRALADYNQSITDGNINGSEAVQEILSMERFYRKKNEINSASFSSNDDSTLKKPYLPQNNFESQHLWDINERIKINNEYNILVEKAINERENLGINDIRLLKKYIKFKVTFIIIVLFIGKLLDIIHLIFS